MNHSEALKAQFAAQIAAHRSDPDPLHGRLINWARWCKSNPSRALSCRSIEHRYRSPQCWYPPEPTVAIDELDAAAVEKTIGKLPEFVRIALAAHYVYAGRYEKNIRTRQTACREMAIHFSKYEETTKRAEKMLANRLNMV